MTNYQRGRNAEYYIKGQYERMGYIVIRSAGSHSSYDLVAIHPRKREIEFIQVSRRKKTKREIDRIFNLSGRFEIKTKIAYIDKRRWILKDIRENLRSMQRPTKR